VSRRRDREPHVDVALTSGDGLPALLATATMVRLMLRRGVLVFGAPWRLDPASVIVRLLGVAKRRRFGLRAIRWADVAKIPTFAELQRIRAEQAAAFGGRS
jgi:hypothetical protein